MDKKQHGMLFVAGEVSRTQKHCLSSIFKCNHVLLYASNHFVIKLPEFVSYRRQVQLFEHVYFEVARIQKLVHLLSLCKNLLNSNSVNLGRETGFAIVDHKSIFEDAHKLIVPEPQITLCHVWYTQHSNLFVSGVEDEYAMLALEICFEQEKFVGSYQELSLRKIFVVTIKPSKFLIVTRVLCDAVNKCFRGGRVCLSRPRDHHQLVV